MIIVVRRKRKSRNISAPITLTADTNNMQLNEVETVDNKHYAKPVGAKPVGAKQENIYDKPKYPTSNVYDQPTGPNENHTNSYENLLTASDHEYDAPNTKRSSTSSLSLMRRKESNSRYERLSNVDKPGDDQ